MVRLGNIIYLPIIMLAINFFISGLLINMVQFLLWVTIKPMNQKLYRKINYYCLYCMWIQIVFLSDWWSSSTCTVVTDDETWAKMGTEHAIVIMNHSFELDWLMGWIVCEQSRLIASSKVFMKKAIKWIPIVGWSWQFAEIIFLERNWEKDKAVMEKQVANLVDYPDPVWLLLFAEGTRYTAAKHAASVEFARRAGLEPLQHLLMPRTKGFLLTVDQVRGRFPAIYSCTLAFDTKEGATPSLKNLLLGRRVIAEMLLERIPLDQVPTDPAEASNWLYKDYQLKDRLLDTYLKQGSFPASLGAGRSFSGPLRGHYRPRRLWSLLIVLGSCYVTLPPVCAALYALLCTGILNILFALFFLLAVSFALYKLVALTKVSKGSAYGSSEAASKTS